MLYNFFLQFGNDFHVLFQDTRVLKFCKKFLRYFDRTSQIVRNRTRTVQTFPIDCFENKPCQKYSIFPTYVCTWNQFLFDYTTNCPLHFIRGFARMRKIFAKQYCRYYTRYFFATEIIYNIQIRPVLICLPITLLSVTVVKYNCHVYLVLTTIYIHIYFIIEYLFVILLYHSSL